MTTSKKLTLISPRHLTQTKWINENFSIFEKTSQ